MKTKIRQPPPMDSLTLDSQMLMDLYGGSYDDVKFILNDYLEKHEEIISSFKEAFHANIESLSRCAHRHSPSFTYIGLPGLTKLCKDFEQECKSAANTTAVSVHYEQLLVTINQGAVLVRQELARLGKGKP